VATPLIAKKMGKLNIVGVDVHKIGKPALPEMCGLSILIGLIGATLILMSLFPWKLREFSAFLLCVLSAGLVGALDDLKPMGPRVKPLLTALASAPILALGAYSPYPSLPFIGRTRLTIVYPILVPFAIAVPANAVNMMDVFNGSMTSTCSILSLTMITCLILLGRIEEALPAAALLGCLLAFHSYNRYPAKVFAGDVGDLCVGAAIGALAVIGRIEVVTIVAMMPHIMNAFYKLSSIGRLYERREITSKPTRLLDDGRLDATSDTAAPLTLARMILAQGPLKENEIVRIMVILTITSSILAIVTLLLILG
jgi:UDP-N-acetylglucosamine--dolichyl-phosphate N-acetylglucosaminephosphotransferase